MNPSRSLAFVCLSSFVFAACDFDHDGLGGVNEDLAGSGPFNPDSDEDGLSDGDEVLVYQTDPTNSDSDGDGDADGVEIYYGFDPNNSKSRSYMTGWPVTSASEKDALSEFGDRVSIAVGGVFVRDYVYGVNGEFVDTFDYARHGKPVVVLAGYYDFVELSFLAIGKPGFVGSEFVGLKIEDDSVLYMGIGMFADTSIRHPPSASEQKKCVGIRKHGCFLDLDWSIYRFLNYKDDAIFLLLLDEDMNVVSYVNSTEGRIDEFANSLAEMLNLPKPYP